MSPPPLAAALIAPTASGKSDLAAAIAPLLNAEIISVDSGAVYRGMDIGTAKPSPAIRARIPHHLIDIAPPTTPYNVGKFYRDAVTAAATIRARGKRPFLVGGSMMYFNALLRGLTDHPPIAPALLAQTRQDAARHGLPALHAELTRRRPRAAATIAATDPTRLIRALCLARANTPQNPRHHPPLPMRILFLLPTDRPAMRARIERRLNAMWQNGLLAETGRLLSHPDLPSDAAPLKMAGYRQAAAHLSGIYGEKEMRQRAHLATCQLAKRQITWIKQLQTLPSQDASKTLDTECKSTTALDYFTQKT